MFTSRIIFRSGNSLVVSLPPEMLTQANIKEGTLVEISIGRRSNCIMITRKHGQHKFKSPSDGSDWSNAAL